MDRARLQTALAEAGGVAAPDRLAAQLRALLLDELTHGVAELRLPRSGYGHPVVVAIAVRSGMLVAAAPLDAGLRADPGLAGERAWLVGAALTGALVEATRDPRRPPAPDLLAGALGPHLALALPLSPGAAQSAEPGDGAEPAELAALAYEELTGPIDRLRTLALAVPGPVLDQVSDLREPVGAAHPLRVAELVARLGGNPADADSVSDHEEQVLSLIGGAVARARPHEDPNPELRVARRILQRLAGMGKWGGYHTDIAHLARGFAGNERALAIAVGEALIDAGLLLQKPSVGQRHVYLNPRRARDINALIESGAVPADLALGARGRR